VPGTAGTESQALMEEDNP